MALGFCRFNVAKISWWLGLFLAVLDPWPRPTGNSIFMDTTLFIIVTGIPMLGFFALYRLAAWATRRGSRVGGTDPLFDASDPLFPAGLEEVPVMSPTTHSLGVINRALSDRSFMGEMPTFTPANRELSQAFAGGDGEIEMGGHEEGIGDLAGMVYQELDSLAPAPTEAKETGQLEAVDIDWEREFWVLVSLPEERDLSESDLRFAFAELGIESDSSGEQLEGVSPQGTGGGDLFHLLGIKVSAGERGAARRYSGAALSMNLRGEPPPLAMKAMLETADKLAEFLDAELFDGEGEPLTQERVNHWWMQAQQAMRARAESEGSGADAGN